MLKVLIEAFKRSKGRMPNPMEMLQLKFKAAEQAGKGKVIQFPKDKITDWTKPRPTTGKKADVVSSGIGKKAETAKTISDDKIIADFMASAEKAYGRFVNETLVKVQNAGKDEQLKIAKDIINRKGMYRNLDDQDAAKILKSIDQNIKPVEPKAGGGIAGMLGERTGYKNAKKVKGRDEEIFYPPYETNDPEEAIKEIIKRLINVEPAKVPLTDKLQLMFDLNRIKAGGSTDLFGGELNFGYNKDFGREGEGIGFEWKKQFAGGGIAGMLGEPTYQDEDHRVPFSGGGGKFVFEGLPAAIRKIMEKFGKKSITTANKIKRPLKAIEAEDTKKMFDNFNNKIATQEALTKGSEKMAGPIKTKNKKGAWDPESTDHTTWLQQEKYFDPKALDMYGKKVPSNWIEVEKKLLRK